MSIWVIMVDLCSFGFGSALALQYTCSVEVTATVVVELYKLNWQLFLHLQDGKTLPNGPVVISPDGLFPSLYREGDFLSILEILYNATNL
jgi:hypothetical protein